MKQKNKYIAEEIGENYKYWNPGHIIFITAPTGAGKSHFILHTYLKWLIQKNLEESGNFPLDKSILYLVNRTILREQIEEELKTEIEGEFYNYFEGEISDIDNYITISTYQIVERQLIRGKVQGVQNFLKKFQCVVCDEAHYFYADSNFNTNTELVYDCIRNEFNEKIQIYMSATLMNVEGIIKKRQPSYFTVKAVKDPNCGPRFVGPMALEQNRFWHYGKTVQQNNENISLQIPFNNLEDLIELIHDKSNEKWLIFVDSINKGKELYDKLLCSAKNNSDIKMAFAEDDIVFIDAKFAQDPKASESVFQITNKKTFTEKIVICTSVMDNGVSLFDSNLKNIVILADTQEEFVQMLGRKRRGDEILKVYICKRNQEHFQRRLNYQKNILEVYNKIKDYSDNMYLRQSDMPQKNLRISAYVNLLSINQYNSIHYDFMLGTQQYFLELLLSNTNKSEGIKSICYSVKGLIDINHFAVQRCKDLIRFYNDMIKQLESDEYAFVKLQGRWLGISDNEIQKLLKEEEEKYRNRVIEVVEDFSSSLTPAENEWYFKHTLRDEMLFFFKKCNLDAPQMSTVKKRNARKNNQSKQEWEKSITKPNPMSVENINLVLEYIGSNYRFRKEKDKFMKEIK